MTIRSLIGTVNRRCDESYSDTDVLDFINDGIAEVNKTLSAIYPFVRNSSVDTEYTAIDETYMRSVVGNYAAYALKMNDGDFSAADRFRTSFAANLTIMNAQYKVEEEYKSSTNTKTIVPEQYVYVGEW